MRILVTGGNGFVGRYIVEQLLARGEQVRVIGRSLYPDLVAQGVECYAIDLARQESCAEALKGVEAVFHVAAKAGVWGRPEEFYASNVLATQHVVREAIKAGVGKLVYTSSPSVTIGEADIEGSDESLPYPDYFLAPYPLTKSIAERFVLARRDILTTAIRPHLIWGPRDPHIIPRIVERAKQGRLIRIGDGKNKVDITYVENVAEAHLLAADALREGSALVGRAYFIGQEHPVNLWEFIGDLLERLELPPVKRSIPTGLAVGVAGVMEAVYGGLRLKREPLLTRLSASQMARSHWFSHAAAERDFGYRPRVSIEEGLVRTVAALKEAW